MDAENTTAFEIVLCWKENRVGVVWVMKVKFYHERSRRQTNRERESSKPRRVLKMERLSEQHCSEHERIIIVYHILIVLFLTSSREGRILQSQTEIEICKEKISHQSMTTTALAAWSLQFEDRS